MPAVSDEERARAEALGAVRLAGVEPAAEVLDCPLGVGRHVVVLAGEGFRAHRRRPLRGAARAGGRAGRGDADWPRLVRGDCRRLPLDQAGSDCARSGGWAGKPVTGSRGRVVLHLR